MLGMDVYLVAWLDVCANSRMKYIECSDELLG